MQHNNPWSVNFNNKTFARAIDTLNDKLRSAANGKGEGEGRQRVHCACGCVLNINCSLNTEFLWMYQGLGMR